MIQKTIICPEAYPGLCNSLFAFATIYACNIDSKLKSKILFFGALPTKHELKIKYTLPFWIKAIKPLMVLFFKAAGILGPKLKLPIKKISFSPDNNITLDSLDLIKIFFEDKSNWIILRGWGYHNLNLLDRHREKILEYMGFNAGMLSKILPAIPKDRDVVTLGIHVRRGDYDKFLNGAYFYGSTEYQNWIDHAVQSLKPTKVIQYFFTNDTDFVKNNFTAKGTLLSSTAVNDLIGLSECDYILGPPSSFTMWACYVGGNKGMHMYRKSPEKSDQFLDWQNLCSFNACIQK